MSILVLGTAALDTVRTPAGRRRQMLGGSAVHFSMSASFFVKVNLVAVVGRDFPKRHKDFLRAKGVDLTSLAVKDGNTFRWSGVYGHDLNTAQTLSTELGVLSVFEPEITEEEKRIEHVFLANVDPDLQRYLLRKMRAPRLIGLDSMNYWIDHKRSSLLKLLKETHIFVVNDAEARSLSGETNLMRAARALRKRGARVVVIKKGEHGVLVYSDDLIFCLPAYPLENIIDPTGAGDTFAGGFMGYLAKAGKVNKESLKKAVLYGTVMASFNVEGFGLERSSKVTGQDLESRLKTFKDIVSF